MNSHAKAKEREAKAAQNGKTKINGNIKIDDPTGVEIKEESNSTGDVETEGEGDFAAVVKEEVDGYAGHEDGEEAGFDDDREDLADLEDIDGLEQADLKEVDDVDYDSVEIADSERDEEEAQEAFFAATDDD